MSVARHKEQTDNGYISVVNGSHTVAANIRGVAANSHSNDNTNGAGSGNLVCLCVIIADLTLIL